MQYAPARGVELPPRHFEPRLPLPVEREAWDHAARAAKALWNLAASDERISDAFRRVCADNAGALQSLMTA